ncbi:hypothetical protein [Halopiger xanaduensis]|uniref:Uncharacterized protein n=1 Tax=Halopiger xanaduensis (strain DSM 18323 / JCM 14033 / SH-6) TaxID=797210 RepID=F8DAC1_HALXS|nr:hypothetical protein [Halopiger xanaduensis]AEH37858.1 hypothetical protein Halxa_3246 [Halopiger xanaduensis SH-6]
MWPESLYAVGGAGTATTGPLASLGAEWIEAYRSLALPVRAGGQFLAAALLALLVLGLVQGYGSRSVHTARRSPVISICIGLPAALVVASLAGTGYLISGESVGVFFGIPLVVLGLATLPPLSAVGLVAIGQSIAARVGDDRLSTGVLVGSLLAGAAGGALEATIALAVLAAALGVGAGARTLFAARGSTRPDERTVPPANKI